MLYVKYGKNRFHGFRGNVKNEKVDGRRTNEDGRTTDAYLYYKLAYELTWWQTSQGIASGVVGC